MNENRESVDCRRICELPLPIGFKTQPGDFAWDTDLNEDRSAERNERYLYLHLPGDTTWCAIRVQRGQPGGQRVWGWDGDEDKPTLTPSIHCPGLWHGFLRAGRLVSC